MATMLMTKDNDYIFCQAFDDSQNLQRYHGKKNRISENRVKKIDDIGVKDGGFVLFEEIKSFFIVISKARIDPPCLFNKSVHSLLSTKKTFHLFVCPAYSMITFKH